MSEVLSASSRDTVGSRNARKMRRDGKVPGVIYSHGEDAVSLTFDHKELSTFLNHAHGLVDLQVSEEKDVRKCVVKSVQLHPVTDNIVHIDFQGVKMGEKLQLSVPIHVTGTPEGLNFGGVFEHILRDLVIECLPKHIPDFLEVDVTALNVGDSLHVSDLSFENLEIITDEHETVAQVALPKVVETVEETDDELEDGEVADGDAAADADGAAEPADE